MFIDDSFFERDDGVVGDADVLGADFGAAFGEVAVADAKFVFEKPRGCGNGIGSLSPIFSMWINGVSAWMRPCSVAAHSSTVRIICRGT